MEAEVNPEDTHRQSRVTAGRPLPGLRPNSKSEEKYLGQSLPRVGLRRRPDQKDYTVRKQQFLDYLLKDCQKPGWMEKGIPYIEREKEKETHNSVYGDVKK